ncbi:tetratricopeptide repeat protein [Hypnocyclicus thermotrophus]|uniref:Tetratricopeptide repeat protein n=1 Tax=Hypnocyclicus thermotrophus TaxID=1627895 RepID=A0AA46DZK3_9FUSO|nr:tetratricopeptide repeat protein [Hypnocyclicus thermotrophus]TDT71497.1 tetratricopeptide repeat protein [Hypnocyclicus thermotrophus]
MKKKLLLLILFSSLYIQSLSSDLDDMKYIQKLYQNKEYEITLMELENFILKYPNSKYYSTAVYMLGNTYYITKDYENAEKNYKKILNSEFSDKAYYYLSVIYINEDREEDAKVVLKKISRDSKYREISTYNLAQYLYKKGKVDEAEIYFKSLISLQGENKKQGLLNLGVISYNKGEYIKATVYLEEYISLEKNDKDNIARAYYMLGVSYKELEDVMSAIDYYVKIENEYKNSVYYNETLRDLMLIYRELKDYKEFENYALKLKGTKYEMLANILLADYKYDIKEYAEAEKYYRFVLEKNENEDIRLKYSLVLLNENKKNETIESLKKLKDTKYHYEYLYYTAYLLYNDKKYKEVLTLLEGYDSNGNVKYENYLDIFLAESAYVLKEFNLAKKYYNKIYTKSKNLEDLYKLVLINSSLENLDELENLYNEYNSNFSNDRKYRKEIYLTIGNIYIKNNELEKGEKVYKEFLKIQDDSVILENLITVLLKRGKYKELLIYLDKEEIDDENIYLRGIANLGLSNFKEAEKAFLSLIKSEETSVKEKERANVKLVEVYLLTKQFEKVIKYAQEYEKNQYKLDYNTIMQNKALAYFRLNQYENARNIYKELEKNNDYKDLATYMIAETYYNEKNYKNAKIYYEKVIKNSKNEKNIENSKYWLINIEYINNNFDVALNKIKEFEDNYKKSEYLNDISYIKANIYLKQNENKLAIKEYKEIYSKTTDLIKKETTAKKIMELYYAENDIQNALKWNNLLKDKNYKTLYKGFIYDKAKQPKKAFEEYLKITKDKKYGDIANYYIGNYYFNDNDYEKAREYYEKVLSFEISEYKDKALFKIGESYELENNYLKAISAFLKIKLIYTESNLQDIVLIKLGELYELDGKFNKALLSFKEYYDKYKHGSDYPYVVEKLMVYYINNKKLNVAKNYYIELKKLNKENASKYKEYFN